jgi:hypothetical protein
MQNQIFKQKVPDELLYLLLDKICLKTEKYYLIDMNSYRKMMFHNYNVEFCNQLTDYYHNGKLFYIFSYYSFY